EKSLKQLESQAKKTDRYYRIKEEYKTISTALALFSIQSYSSRLESLQQREQEQGSSKNEYVTELEKLEQLLQDLKTESAEREKTFSTAQKELNEKLLAITRFENEEKNR